MGRETNGDVMFVENLMRSKVRLEDTLSFTLKELSIPTNSAKKLQVHHCSYHACVKKSQTIKHTYFRSSNAPKVNFSAGHKTTF